MPITVTSRAGAAARSSRRRSGLPSRTATRRCARCGQDATSGGHTVVATSFGAMTRACRRCPSRISSASAVSAAAPLPAPSGAIKNGRVALVEPGCGALLVRTQDAREEGRVHGLRSAAFALRVVGADALLRLQRQTCGPVRQGQHLAPQDRLRLLGARLVDLADDLIMRRHADRHERERRVGLDPRYRLAQEVGGGGLDRVLAKSAVP